MKKTCFLIGLAAIGLTSCSQEEVLSVNNSSDNDNVITFRVRSSKPSRAMEFSTNSLDEFMVYGFKGDVDEEPVIPYFQDGKPIKFTREENGTLFTSAIPYYYPTDGSWLYFAAYAPADLPMVSFGDRGGIKHDNFTVNPDITKQVDIICANGGSNLGKDELGNDEPDQSLFFEHALTKVYISTVANQDTRFKYEIMGVRFGNIHNSGDFEYRGDKNYYGPRTPESINGIFESDGYINDANGTGFYWKPAGEQTGMMDYIFASPVVLDNDNTSATVMTGDDTAIAGSECFMLIPQRLSESFVDEEGVLTSSTFDAGMSYIAFLVRITNLITNEVIYPYAEGVEAITQTIGEGADAVKYAWAAFPVSSLWVPGSFIDYYVDFSKGAGFVAPGASADVVLQPILGREIKFYEEVDTWDDGSYTTVEHPGELGVDVGGEEDPFGMQRR